MNTEGVTIHYRGDFKVLEIDTRKAKYQGLSWRDLGEYGKKKFENITFIQNARNEYGAQTKILYV